MILGEAMTGRGIDGPTDFEEIVAALADETFAEGWFTVLRDGEELRAAAVLSRGE